MKQFLFLFLMILFSSPVFAETNETTFYDISEQQVYAEELEKKFFEKYDSFTGEDYRREVIKPYYDYLYKKQKTEKTGLEIL